MIHWGGSHLRKRNVLDSRLNRKPRHLEDELQSQCVQWFRLQYPEPEYMIFAIPNGGKRSPVEAAIMKGTGVRAGIPDLCIITKGTVAFVEMKHGNNKPTATQLETLKTLDAMGYLTDVCNTFEKFQAFVWTHFGKIVIHELTCKECGHQSTIQRKPGMRAIVSRSEVHHCGVAMTIKGIKVEQ